MTRAIIDDVAKRAGVSIKTVSRVMNNEPNVRDLTRKKVLAAAKALKYRPNRSARVLAGNRSYLLAFFYNNPSANYLANVQAGILETCEERQYGLVMKPLESKSDTLVDDALEFIQYSSVDGVILSPPLSDKQHLVAALEDRAIPYVSISPPKKNACMSVSIDEFEGAYQMTSHLIDIGHRRIAFIKGHPSHGSSTLRFDGYCAALHDSRIALDDALVQQGYFTHTSGMKAAELLMGAPVRPTAIFAGNDDMAAGVVQYLLDHDITIPADMSVVGFDDTLLSRQIWPKLSTVRQPIRQMGTVAASTLINFLKTRKKQDSSVLPFELKIRKSSAPYT